MKIEVLKPGMVVYDCHSRKMGNTRLSSLGTWEVRIIEVDPAGKFVLASWNGNTPRKFYREFSRWTKNKPHLVRTGFGSFRRETREERKSRLSPTTQQNKESK